MQVRLTSNTPPNSPIPQPFSDHSLPPSLPPLPLSLTALDVGAFERLLGPCMEVMKRNFGHYEEQLMQLFGTTLDITDTR